MPVARGKTAAIRGTATEARLAHVAGDRSGPASSCRLTLRTQTLRAVGSIDGSTRTSAQRGPFCPTRSNAPRGRCAAAPAGKRAPLRRASLFLGPPLAAGCLAGRTLRLGASPCPSAASASGCGAIGIACQRPASARASPPRANCGGKGSEGDTARNAAAQATSGCTGVHITTAIAAGGAPRLPDALRPAAPSTAPRSHSSSGRPISRPTRRQASSPLAPSHPPSGTTALTTPHPSHALCPAAASTAAGPRPAHGSGTGGACSIDTTRPSTTAARESAAASAALASSRLRSPPASSSSGHTHPSPL